MNNTDRRIIVFSTSDSYQMCYWYQKLEIWKISRERINPLSIPEPLIGLERSFDLPIHSRSAPDLLLRGSTLYSEPLIGLDRSHDLRIPSQSAPDPLPIRSQSPPYRGSTPICHVTCINQSQREWIGNRLGGDRSALYFEPLIGIEDLLSDLSIYQ